MGDNVGLRTAEPGDNFSYQWHWNGYGYDCRYNCCQFQFVQQFVCK